METLTIEIKKQQLIVASDVNDFDQQIKAIKSTLQPNEKAVVTKNIVGTITIVRTT